MGTFLTMILPALVPALADGLRGLVGRITHGAGAMPQSVDERIRLMQAESAKLQALALLDAPGPGTASWVQSFRASFRYIAVSVVILATLGAAFAGEDVVAEGVMLVLLDLTGACMSFIIGERMYLKLAR